MALPVSNQQMNSFEQYTLIIGLLAVLFEAVSHLTAFVKKIFHQ